jgi:hypothetical protein
MPESLKPRGPREDDPFAGYGKVGPNPKRYQAAMESLSVREVRCACGCVVVPLGPGATKDECLLSGGVREVMRAEALLRSKPCLACAGSEEERWVAWRALKS